MFDVIGKRTGRTLASCGIAVYKEQFKTGFLNA